jgi:hypothetical protein
VLTNCLSTRQLHFLRHGFTNLFDFKAMCLLVFLFSFVEI